VVRISTPIPVQGDDMRATIGLNALAQTMDRGAFDAAIKLLKPAATLIMDDVGLARALKAQYPDMLVVHRSYFAGDEQGHLSMTPAGFLNAFGASGAGGVVVQALNEPSGSANIPQLINWCAELMALAKSRGIRLALPNFGVGNPDDNDVKAGVWDGLLRAFAAHPEHYFALHEYFRDEPKNEPFLTGRYRAFLDRAAALGLPRPTIIVTEFGRDFAGGISDGWRGIGISEDQFADKCIAAMDIYQRDGIPVMTYCFGTGFDNRWQSFNIHNAGTWLARISAYNAQVKDVITAQGQAVSTPQEAIMGGTSSAVPKPDGLVLQDGTLAKLPDGAQYVNQRAAPDTTGTILQRILKNDSVLFGVAADFPGWLFVAKDNISGWVSAQDGRVIFAPKDADAKIGAVETQVAPVSVQSQPQQPVTEDEAGGMQPASLVDAITGDSSDEGTDESSLFGKLTPDELAQVSALLSQIANLNEQVAAILSGAARR